MDINTDTSLDELLELWTKYAYRTFKDGIKVIDDVENRKRINGLLVTKGVVHIEISNMTEDVYTIRYRYRTTWQTKEVPIIKE